ncbi:nitrogen fixation-related uncharacterized protein [Nonomuraea rubra]|uniref:Nitrogen fixation-related uncharacterized protein n=1 Tax=Nonomuraea rubra TaxID=46180 RepID=A0A7X0U5R2_9ACTN|nr:nitrogen fixation-related uncharacterized protein [Nonomuraea rubra]
MTGHQCVRPDTHNTDPWRCPDCGTLWEPLPAAAVAAPGWRRWLGWLETAARIAGAVAVFAFLWTIGMRTAAVALTLGALAAWGCLWGWTRLRGKHQSGN